WQRVTLTLTMVRSGAEPSIAAFSTDRKLLAPHGAAEAVPPVEPPVSVAVSVTVVVTVTPLEPDPPLPPQAAAAERSATATSTGPRRVIRIEAEYPPSRGRYAGSGPPPAAGSPPGERSRAPSRGSGARVAGGSP